MRRSVRFAIVLGVCGLAAVVWTAPSISRSGTMRPPYSVDDRLTEYGAAVEARLAPRFRAAGLAYPPRELALVVLKEERRLEMWGRDARGAAWKHVRDYAVLAASGRAGPKLREGDFQVPEGIYRIALLNPNSRYHLSVRLDYPNAFDRRMARAEGRTRLGGDIMIHGNAVSIGCIAIGDLAAEDVFVLTALVGIGNVRVIVAPADFRAGASVPSGDDVPVWTAELYDAIASALAEFARGASGLSPLPQ